MTTNVNAFHQDDNKSVTINLFAAAGTLPAVQQIVEQYQSTTTRKVTVNFASSSTLARQIESGAPFDVYISANTKWLDYVQKLSRIDAQSRQNIAADRLVLVASVKSAVKYTGMSLKEILDSSSGKIAVGDWSHVPCGIYTRQALLAIGHWDVLQERLVPAASVRTAQQYIELNQCDFAIIYQAGALQSQKVKILAQFDETLHEPIRYTTACAVNSSAGKQLVQYMTGPEAQSIFRHTGYISLEKEINTPADVSPIDTSNAQLKSEQWQAIALSLKVAAVCTFILALPGVVLGYLLARKSFPGCSIINAIIHLPMVIPPVVTGYLALIALGRNSPFGQWLSDTFGLSISFTWIAAVIVSAIMGLPLLVRSVKTAVEMIDPRYSQAASTLGIGPIKTFVTVILPLAAPGILAGLILAFARSLGEFGATVTFAGNIPGKTQTLSLAIYNFTQIPGGETAAIHLVLVSVSLCFIAMLGSEMLSRKMKYLTRTNR